MGSAPTLAELYAEVQLFYARQMQGLDSGKLEAYADTFTEDAEFSHTPGREPARTRAGILADLEDFHKRFEGDPLRRRHWFNMIDIDPQPDGTIISICYALVVKIRPGKAPEIAASCVVHDVLTRAGGELLNKSRRVEYDPAL
ncbi:nuclear transport factor 2 family protein [Actinomadura syzygii]|uniref:Nuclear transport factor 2 family protein n=1 Tax=Actinomadura syzygii TaxID=1427538 RepID=A0A5D0UBP2_9ACTN|nr:nuclear transport factor 2 family protein [Actinomadura syzygii]TYC15961.1 nuclear transport factor 2 family protein [Actinomadura syzygii]